MRAGTSVLPSLLAAAVLTACGGGEERASGDGRRGTPLGTPPLAGPAAAAEGLCLTLEALDGDPDAAANVFLDRAHDTLHDIAAALEKNETGLAGRLLEQKQKVESQIETNPDDPALRSDVENLLKTTEGALDKLGLPVPECTR